MSTEANEIVSRLVSFKEASAMCGGLSVSAFRDRKAGTHNLTHVPFGRRVMLIREEVEKLIEDQIAAAQAEERKRRKNFRLVTGQR